MKLGLILALAAWFHRATWERIGNPLFLLPPIIAVLIPVGLILKEPNLGTAMITLMLGGVIFFAAGVRWWKFAPRIRADTICRSLCLSPSARLPARTH